MIIILNRGKFDTDKLTYEEMQGLLLNLDTEIADVKQQLRSVTIEYYTNGKRANPYWFGKATYALKAMQRNRQELQILIGQRRRRSEYGRKTISDFFLDAAKENIPIEEFDRILSIAKQRKEECANS